MPHSDVHGPAYRGGHGLFALLSVTVAMAALSGCSNTSNVATPVASSNLSTASALPTTTSTTTSTGALPSGDTATAGGAACAQTSSAGLDGVLNWKDVWPRADGGGHSQQVTALSDCRIAKVAKVASAGSCEAGFPWYATSTKAQALADAGVLTETRVSLAGPNDAQVSETVLQFDHPDDPGIRGLRAVAGQCATPSTRDGIEWVNVNGTSTAITVTGKLLIGIEFDNTELSASDQAATVHLAIKRAPALSS